MKRRRSCVCSPKERRNLENHRNDLFGTFGGFRETLQTVCITPLSETDQQLASLQKAEWDYRESKQRQIDGLRNEIYSIETENQECLAQQLRQMRDEADQLREDLIPRVRAYLNDLEERRNKANQQTLQVANLLARSSMEAPDLDRFDLAE